jgi:hypothetical protein
MPRTPIDYSNTIIYKICCKDITITDIYIGHTTNFYKRKNAHKNRYDNPNTKYYCYVYQFIRNNGGWDNWDMIELERIICIDKLEACKYERKYIEDLQATLNKYIPIKSEIELHNDHINYCKEYYITNKITLTEHRALYRQNNLEHVRALEREAGARKRLKKKLQTQNKTI